MQADADEQRHAGPVADLERLDGAEQVERQVGDGERVLVAVTLRQPAHHHVRVTDRLHLATNARTNTSTRVYGKEEQSCSIV